MASPPAEPTGRHTRWHRLLLRAHGALLERRAQSPLLVAGASSLGALLAFLVARTLLRDLVRRRFGRQLAPVFPFVLINLLMALTPMRSGSFDLTSQFGMLPGTLVDMNADTQLAQLRG